MTELSKHGRQSAGMAVRSAPSHVIPGLGPGIQVLDTPQLQKTGMAGTSPAMTKVGTTWQSSRTA